MIKTALAEPIELLLYLMDIPTAARRLSTTVFAVRTLIHVGKLKFVRIGHKMLISPQAIQDFIANSEGYYEDAA